MPFARREYARCDRCHARTLSGFENDELGGRSVVATLAKAVFSSEGVQKGGDTKCRAFYPGLYFTDVPSSRDGAKVKADLGRTPTVVAITDLHVVVVNQILDGWIDMTFPRTSVSNPRWITVGGMLVQPKFWCLQFDTLEEGETETDTLCLGRGFTSGVQDSIRAEVEQALSA